MAETNQDIIIRLKASDETGKTFETVGKNVEKTQSSFKSMAGAVAVGTAAFEIAKGAIQAVSGFLQESVQAALEDEQAFSGLQNTIKLAGVQTDAANAQFQAQVEHLKQLGFAGAQVNEAQSRFLQLTKDATEATKLSNLAAEVARQKNIDLGSATDFLQRVMLNGGAAARKMGYAVSETATNVEALDAIQKQAGKSAEAFANTTAGKIAIAQTAWEELKGALGSQFLPVLAEVATFITKVATDPRMEQFLTTVGNIVTNYVVPAIQFLVTTLGNFGKFAGQILSGFADIFGATSEDVGRWVNILGEVFKVLVTSLGTAALLILSGFKTLVGGFVAFGKSMAATAATIWNAILDGVQMGLSFISKQINKVIEAYDTVSKALGGKGTETRVNFDVSKYKVDTGTIDALNSGAQETLGKTIDSFKKDMGSIGNFVTAQVNASKPQVQAAATSAGAAAGDAYGGAFSKNVLGKIAKGQGGGGGISDEMKKQLDQMFFNLKQQGDVVTKSIEEAKTKTKEWHDIAASVQDAYKDVGYALRNAGIQVTGLTDAQKNVKLTAKEAVASAIEDMKKYAQATIETKNQIADLAQKVKDLQKEQAGALAGNASETARSAAEAIAAKEKDLADLKSQLALTSNADDATALQKQINEAQDILTKQADFITKNQAEVDRARKLANMDEISRILALGDEKSAQLKKEYDDKIKAAQAELQAAQDKYDKELAMLQAANANVATEREKAQAEYAQYLLEGENLTNAHIQAEINKYNQLAAAIRAASSGVSSTFTPEQNSALTQYLKGVPKMADGGIVTKPTLVLAGEAGAEAIVPLSKAGGVGGNVTINLGGVVVKEEADEDRLVRKLSRVLQTQRYGLASPA